MKKPLLSEMTLREKIGQMLLPYQYHVYCHTDQDPVTKKTDEEVKEYMQKEQFGTIWADQVDVYHIDQVDLSDPNGSSILSENHRQVLKKQNSYLKIPALASLDCEDQGAGVMCKDLTRTCKPMAIGATASEELAEKLGSCIAKEIRCAGANWRWAPVVDISSRFSTGYTRTFSPDNPDDMIRLANAHIRGIQAEGVAATAKHFPGGDRHSYRDSHFVPGVLSSSMEEWWEEQGKIFQGIIDGGVYSVMISHKGFPACDDSKLKNKYRPSTVSKKVITDLLKGKMGFKGVVVTDAIVMSALTGCYDSYEELIIDLVNAGNDVILGVYPGAGDIIEKAIKDGKIEESRIDDACQRVLDMKEKIGLFDGDHFTPPYKSEDVTPITRKVNKEIAEKSITLLYDNQNLLPLDKNKIKNVTIVCSAHIDKFFKSLDAMKKCLEERGMNVRLQRRIGSYDEMEEIDATSDLIIYAGYVAGHAPKGLPTFYGEECATFHYAFNRGVTKSIGLSMGYPYLHYDIMANAETFVNAYGMSPEIMEAFVKCIFGELPFEAKSPVKVKPDPLVLY